MSRVTAPEPSRGSAPSKSPPDNRYVPGENWVRGLGWFSIALGAAEILAPQFMARLTGTRRPQLMWLYGVREIISGIGILATARPTGWMWTRVIGDAIDLATLSEPLLKSDAQLKSEGPSPSESQTKTGALVTSDPQRNSGALIEDPREARERAFASALAVGGVMLLDLLFSTKLAVVDAGEGQNRR